MLLPPKYTLTPKISEYLSKIESAKDVINAIGRYPRSERVKELKRLADHVWLIESRAALRWWEQQVQEWVATHNTFLKEKKYEDNSGISVIRGGTKKPV